MDNDPNIEFNNSRIRWTHSFQYKQYHSLTLDASLEVALHNAEPEEVIAEGVKTIQSGIGIALVEILKRYDANKSNAQLQAMLDTIIPPALRITVKTNEFLMDSLLMAAQRELEKDG